MDVPGDDIALHEGEDGTRTNIKRSSSSNFRSEEENFRELSKKEEERREREVRIDEVFRDAAKGY